jgi:hypothetical protein
MLIDTGQQGPVSLVIEPEGTEYEFPPAEKVQLTFRGPSSMKFEISHAADCLTIWRPADTEVWAAALPGESIEQIAWAAIPFPWLDNGGAGLGPPPWVGWDHLRLPTGE